MTGKMQRKLQQKVLERTIHAEDDEAGDQEDDDGAMEIPPLELRDARRGWTLKMMTGSGKGGQGLAASAAKAHLSVSIDDANWIPDPVKHLLKTDPQGKLGTKSRIARNTATPGGLAASSKKLKGKPGTTAAEQADFAEKHPWLAERRSGGNKAGNKGNGGSGDSAPLTNTSVLSVWNHDGRDAFMNQKFAYDQMCGILRKAEDMVRSDQNRKKLGEIDMDAETQAILQESVMSRSERRKAARAAATRAGAEDAEVLAAAARLEEPDPGTLINKKKAKKILEGQLKAKQKILDKEKNHKRNKRGRF